MDLSPVIAHTRRFLPILAGLAAAVGAFAAVAAGLYAPHGTPPSRTQLAWSALAAVVPGVFTFVQTRRALASSQRRKTSVAQATLPAYISGQPPQRTNYFSGRKALLNELERRLKGEHRVVLFGLAGTGKTQLVVAYENAHRTEYDRTWWIRAEQPETLLEDMAALADANHLAASESSIHERINLAWQWLHDSVKPQRWLLVFDNAESEEAIEPYLPHKNAGHVVITSRHRLWAEESIEVTEWQPEEAASFLRRFAGCDERTAQKLAERLGNLPLALEQARAYLVSTAQSPETYLSLLEDQPAYLFTQGKPARYSETVATAWLVSLEKVRDREAAIELLWIFAFLAPEDIPRELVRGHLDELPAQLRKTLSNQTAYVQALQRLAELSLVALTESSLSIHRLLQEQIRYHLDTPERLKWAGVTIDILTGAYPRQSEDPNNWPLCARLLPHTLTALHNAKPLDIKYQKRAMLLHLMSKYIWARSELQRAKELEEEALNLYIRAYQGSSGPGFTLRAHPALDSPDHASSLYNYGRILRALGDFVKAQTAVQLAASIRLKKGSESLDLADALNTKGLILWNLGEREGAREILQQVVDVQRSALGPDHPSLASSLTNLGSVVAELGQRDAGRDLIEESLQIYERAGYQDTHDKARALGDLGLVLADLADTATSLSCLERSRAIFEDRLGPRHPHVAWSLHNIAYVYANNTHLERALGYYIRSFRIRVDVFGIDHPAVAKNAGRLALVLRQLGRTSAAEQLRQCALGIYKRQALPGFLVRHANDPEVDLHDLTEFPAGPPFGR